MNGVPRDTERRVGERRRTRRAPSADESWFGAFESDEEVTPFEETDAADSIPTVSRFGGDDAEENSRALARQAARDDGPRSTSFDRLHRTFIGARAVLGVALVATLVLLGVFGARPSLPVTLICISYAALAISMWLLPRLWPPANPQALARLASPQWLVTIGADLACFTTLHVLAPGSSLNYVALLVMPVLMAGVLTPRTMAPC